MKYYKCLSTSAKLIEDSVRANNLEHAIKLLSDIGKEVQQIAEINFPLEFKDLDSLLERCLSYDLFAIPVGEWYEIRDLGTTLWSYEYFYDKNIHIKDKSWAKNGMYILDREIITGYKWWFLKFKKDFILKNKTHAVETK